MKYSLLLLLGWSLLAASVLPSLARACHCLSAEATQAQMLSTPAAEADDCCGGSTTDRCCEEHENPTDIPPGRLSFPEATISGLVFVPYPDSALPEVYLERFIPPQNRS